MSMPYHSFSHEAMTTHFDMLVVHGDRKYAQQAAAAVFAEIDRVERLLSRFDPGTDLARINRLRPGEFLVVNMEVVDALEIASRAYESTGGAFDPAYRSRQDGRRESAMEYLMLSRPDEGAAGPREFFVGFAAEAAEQGYGVDMEIPIGAQRLEPTASVDPTPPDGLNLDLGGLGKGYALDTAIGILGEWDVDNFLISSGTSTVLARGAGPEGQGWPVGVSGDFREDTGIAKVYLKDKTLSGSGTAVKGQHIRSPESGGAAPALAAWALADLAAWTDCVSTALMVMPVDRSEQFSLEHPDTAVMVVYPDSKPLVRGPWPSEEKNSQ